MKHFAWTNRPVATSREIIREGILPICGILGITAILVGLFALCIHFGAEMNPVVPIHMDDGETVDPNPLRMVFMILGFVLSFVFAFFADRKGKLGLVLPSFFLGYTGGTLLWQSVGECAWHFSIVGDDYLMCFPHIEGASAIFMVIITTILLAYCFKREAFSWGIWVFVLSFVGNWFGHFVLIGTYPLIHSLLEEEIWFKAAGATLGTLTCVTALIINIFAAKDIKARLCCCLMLYFGIGIIVTGVTGI